MSTFGSALSQEQPLSVPPLSPRGHLVSSHPGSEGGTWGCWAPSPPFLALWGCQTEPPHPLFAGSPWHRWQGRHPGHPRREGEGLPGGCGGTSTRCSSSSQYITTGNTGNGDWLGFLALVGLGTGLPVSHRGAPVCAVVVTSSSSPQGSAGQPGRPGPPGHRGQAVSRGNPPKKGLGGAGCGASTLRGRHPLRMGRVGSDPAVFPQGLPGQPGSKGGPGDKVGVGLSPQPRPPPVSPSCIPWGGGTGTRC